MKKEIAEFMNHMEATMDKELNRYFDNPERPAHTVTIKVDGKSITLEYVPDLHYALLGAMQAEHDALKDESNE